MKKVYSILTSVAMLMGFGASAQLCFVNDPVNLQGSVPIIALPTGWSVDLTDPLIVQVWTGDVVIVDDGTGSPTLGCNPLVNGGAISGNIAMVDRGSCEFGVKALNAQNEGAIAVVVCNNGNPAPGSMGAGAQGANVTIPVIMISQADCGTLRAVITGGGTLNISIGRDLNLAHDLKTSRDSVVVAPAFAMPAHQIRAAGDYMVDLGGIVTNVGTNTETNVTMTGMVDFMGNNMFTGSWNVATLDPDAFYGDVMGAPLDIFPGSQGEYSLTYDVTADSADLLPDDNSYAGNFLVTNSTYSICRVDPATMAPITGNGLRSSTGNSMLWGIVMPIKYGTDIQCTSVSFSGAVNAPDSLTGITTTAYVYEWTDTDASGSVNDMAELNLVGSNYGFPYPSVPNYTLVTTDIYDLNFGPLFLNDNTDYFVAIEYTDQAVRPYFFNTDAGINYEVQNRVSGREEQALNIDGTLYVGFTGGAVPVIVVNLDQITSTPQVPMSAASIQVLPNPVTTTLNVNVAFPTSEQNVYYQITDVQGRAVMFQKRGTVSSETFTHDVSSLANGTYYFSVKSESGRQTVAFTIAR